MQDRKSIYSLNKADSDAIVYIDADGKTIRLTRQDFATAQEQFSAAFVLEIRTRLTEIQFRRLWLYYIESKTVYEIAELDGVAHQNVSKAIKAAKKKILKIFQKQGAKQPSKRR